MLPDLDPLWPLPSTVKSRNLVDYLRKHFDLKGSSIESQYLALAIVEGFSIESSLFVTVLQGESIDYLTPLS